MLGSPISILVFTTLVVGIYGWPDGAPCVHAAVESMNPLEAVEHQGGLQLTVPPYEIAVDQKCYWRNQPIGLTLQGMNESVWFKGFVIQPFQWNNDQLGRRIGQLVRLDDNGSWQQQCFRFKDSATHSHDEKKKHIKMWWKVDEEIDTVQFVATVVKHQTQFWVKSIRSKPLPPCRSNRDGFPSYTAPLPTVPPQVKQFKMETFRVFDSIGAQALDLAQAQAAQQPQPSSATPHLTKIIEVPDGFRRGSASFSSQPSSSSSFADTSASLPVTTEQTSTTTTTTTTTQAPFVQTFQRVQQQQQQPQPFRSRQRIIAQQPSSVFQRRRGQNNFSSSNRQNFNQQQQQQQRGSTSIGAGAQCLDRDPQGRCSQWRQFCRSPSHQRYLSTFCAQTCNFCR